MFNMQKLQSNLRFLNDNQAKETNCALETPIHFALARDHSQWNSSGTAITFGKMGLNGEWTCSP